MLHREGDFGENFARILANDRCAQNAVTAFGGQNFDKAMRFAFGNRPVEIIKIVARDIERQALRARFRFGQADRRQFGFRIGDTWQDAVIGAIFFERPRQCIHAGIPCLMTAAVRQLLASGNVARTIYVRHVRAQKIIILKLAIDNQPQFFKTKARHPRLAPDGNDDVIIGYRFFTLGSFNDQSFSRFKTQCTVGRVNGYAFGLQSRGHQCSGIGILFQQQPIRHFDDGHFRTQTLECLCEFAANGPATQNHQTVGRRWPVRHDIPQSLARQIAAILHTRQRRDERCGPRGDDEGFCG